MPKWSGVVGFALALLLGGWAAHAATAEKLQLNKGVVNLQNDQIPRNLRVEMFAQHMMISCKTHPKLVITQFREYGLSVDEDAVSRLCALYGDFNLQQQKEYKRRAAKLGTNFQAQQAVALNLEQKRLEFVGAVFGGWLRDLRGSGHEVRPFLRVLLQNPPSGGMGFLNIKPTQSMLHEQSDAFARGFKTGFGAGLDSVLRPTIEGGKQ